MSSFYISSFLFRAYFATRRLRYLMTIVVFFYAVNYSMVPVEAGGGVCRLLDLDKNLVDEIPRLVVVNGRLVLHNFLLHQKLHVLNVAISEIYMLKNAISLSNFNNI